MILINYCFFDFLQQFDFVCRIKEENDKLSKEIEELRKEINYRKEDDKFAAQKLLFLADQNCRLERGNQQLWKGFNSLKEVIQYTTKIFKTKNYAHTQNISLTTNFAFEAKRRSGGCMATVL